LVFIYFYCSTSLHRIWSILDGILADAVSSFLFLFVLLIIYSQQLFNLVVFAHFVPFLIIFLHMPCHVLFVLGKKWSKATTVLHTFFSLLINWKVYFIADNEKCFWHTYTGNTWAWWKRSIYCVWRCRCLSCTNPLYLFWFLMHSMPEKFLGTYSMFHLM
jgi:hypothetical protein